jgi:hypothetical protein
MFPKAQVLLKAWSRASGATEMSLDPEGANLINGKIHS